ncbi:phenylacetate-CoA oxygenase subunit PaaC [soil metagenome]
MGADPLVRYTLRLGDDCLIMAQRLAEWTAKAPELEEDVALSNIALDLLGQARMFLTYAGQVEGAGRDEDALAYLRGEDEFSNCQLVETERGDFARTMARLLAFSTYQLLLYQRLVESSDETLAAIAAKGVKEVAYHVDHATQWVLRLGDGTAESHRRMQAGLEDIWPFVAELFVAEDGGLHAAVDVTDLRPQWDRRIDAVLTEATLTRPEPTWTARGGRHGRHTEAFGPLLAELQSLHRVHPGATW